MYTIYLDICSVLHYQQRWHNEVQCDVLLRDLANPPKAGQSGKYEYARKTNTTGFATSVESD